MSKIFKQQTNRKSVGLLSGNIPALIHHHFGKPSTYEVDGCVHKASCVGCLNPQCIRFSSEDIKLPDQRFSEFPVDTNDAVCPLNAIVWERGERMPTILSERCINCGICARRCIYGAIYSDGKTGIIHNGEPEVHFFTVSDESKKSHYAQVVSAKESRHVGQYTAPTAEFIGTVYEKLREMQTESQFPNLITRNLLLVLGNKCIIRRRGDVNFRIDAIVTDHNSIGIIEIEFHKNFLEPPRAILDDIAVLSSRYCIAKNEIKPFIVSLEFPNNRTEYWGVIRDIRDVLDIRIHSLTLGALCLLVWSFNEVPIGLVDFYADVEAPIIKTEVERLCGFGELPKLSAYAAFEPIK